MFTYGVGLMNNLPQLNCISRKKNALCATGPQSTILHNNSPYTISEESLVTVQHTTRHRPLRCMSCKIHTPKPWLSALVLVPFICANKS